MLVDLHVRFGGIFVRYENKRVEYVAGDEVEVFKNIDLDMLSVFDFRSCIRNSRYSDENIQIFYVSPGMSLSDGLKPISTDSDGRDLINIVDIAGVKMIDVYIEHFLNTPVDIDYDEEINDEPIELDVESLSSDFSCGQEEEILCHTTENECPLVDEMLDDDICPDTPDVSDDDLDNNQPKDLGNSGVGPGPAFSLFQTFKDAKEFREAVTNYSVSNHRPVKFDRSNKDRVLVKCCDKNYPWRIWCSIEKRLHKFQIKTYKETHTCVVSNLNSLCDSRWLAKKFLEKFRRNINYKAADLRAECLQMFGVSVSYAQCFRARHKALRKLQGNQKEHFEKLRSYRTELLKTNQGSKIIIETNGSVNGKPIFQRMYIGFEALRKGWVEACRPIIGLDGAFLKWFVKGELLSAVGRDANNQMFPIAWAVVEVENIDTWSWFIKHLMMDLEITTGKGLTLMSDGQKGLLRAIKDVFPNAIHGSCARHIYANWRKTWKQSESKPLFWAVARAYTVEQFNEAVVSVKKVSVEAAVDLQRSKMEAWCRAYFTEDEVCEVVHNNMSESFNSSIRGARAKPIIGMLEDIRVAVMKRMAFRIGKIKKWKGEITPKAEKEIQKNLSNSLYAEVIPNGRQKWEVRYGDDACVVDMERKYCSCREWSLSGIPCYHSLAVISRMKAEIVDYVSPFYTRLFWEKTYQHVLDPINGERMWPRSYEPDIQPPRSRKMPGRPKRNRIKDPYESPTRKGNASRHGRVITCTHCHLPGHNKAGCSRRKSGLPPSEPQSTMTTQKHGRPATEDNSQASTSARTRPKKPRSKFIPAEWNKAKSTQSDKET